MADKVQVILAKESVSDDSFLFVEALKSEGETAEAGEIIARVETSKATMDITAPCKGHVFYCYRTGQDIPVGEALAVISPDGSPIDPVRKAEAIPDPEPAAIPEATGTAEVARIRFTPLAKKLMAEHRIETGHFTGPGRVDKEAVMEVAERNRLTALNGVPVPAVGGAARFSQAALAENRIRKLGPERFTGLGLVTRADVLRLAGETAAPAVPPPRESAPSASVATSLSGGRRIPLAKAKKNEIQSLQDGQKGALSSAISILVSGEGFFDSATGAGKGNLLSILIFEMSRLLAQFPELNGCFDNDAILHWPEVNIGVAFEIDSGLKVPVVKDANKLGVDAIKDVIDGHVMKYLENRLGLDDLMGATVTVTDLSNEQVFTFLPLINRHQSAILGIGGCNRFSDTAACFPLTLTFDHRVSTGRRASRFLLDLKGRLESYGQVLAGEAVSGVQRSCSECRRSESELSEKQYLLLMERRGRTDFICSTCMKGW